MARRIIALLIACYAIAFAFGAMAAIRWPSLMLLAGLMVENESLGVLGDIDWRQLGIAYGAPYFLAALCFYAAAISLGQRKKDPIVWYLMGCFSGFPCIFLVDFEPQWWQDPSAGEGAVAGAALAALLLGLAVRELTFGPVRKRSIPPKAAAPVTDTPKIDPEPQITPQSTPLPTAISAAKPRRRGPVPAAIARQRAHFAAEGKRMRARRQR